MNRLPARQKKAFPWGLCPAQRIEMNMTAGGSHTSTTVVRLKPDRMRGGRGCRVAPSKGFPSRGSLYAPPVLRIEFERAGHAAAPTMPRRYCLPPLIRLP